MVSNQAIRRYWILTAWELSQCKIKLKWLAKNSRQQSAERQWEVRDEIWTVDLWLVDCSCVLLTKNVSTCLNRTCSRSGVKTWNHPKSVIIEIPPQFLPNFAVLHTHTQHIWWCSVPIFPLMMCPIPIHRIITALSTEYCYVLFCFQARLLGYFHRTR
jgi:hypothetical protein